MDTTPDTTAAPTPVTYKPANGVAVTIPGFGSVPASGIVSGGAIEVLDRFVGGLLVKIEGEVKEAEQTVVGEVKTVVAAVKSEVETVVTEVEGEVKGLAAKAKGLFHRANGAPVPPAVVAPVDPASPAAPPANPPVPPADSNKTAE